MNEIESTYKEFLTAFSGLGNFEWAICGSRAIAAHNLEPRCLKESDLDIVIDHDGEQSVINWCATKGFATQGYSERDKLRVVWPRPDGHKKGPTVDVFYTTDKVFCINAPFESTYKEVLGFQFPVLTIKDLLCVRKARQIEILNIMAGTEGECLGKFPSESIKEIIKIIDKIRESNDTEYEELLDILCAKTNRIATYNPTEKEAVQNVRDHIDKFKKGIKDINCLELALRNQ